MQIMTTHAGVRSRQRSISPFVLDLLLLHGEREASFDGSETVYFAKRSRKSLMKLLGRRAYDKLEEMFDAYLVQSRDGKIITVGHRNKRIRRK